METRIIEKARAQLGPGSTIVSGTDVLALLVHSTLLLEGLAYIGGEFSECNLFCTSFVATFLHFK